MADQPGEKMMVFKDRVIEKRTMCANCVHFDADATKILEEWAPLRALDEQRVQRLVQFSGLEMDGGFERGDAGLKVAQLVGSGLTMEEAIQRVEVFYKDEARRRVGDELWKADKRYGQIVWTEAGIRSGLLGRCRGNGEKENGNPVDFLLFSGFHCHKWSGRTGYSVAHDGKPLDPLPDELTARADEKAITVKKD